MGQGCSTSLGAIVDSSRSEFETPDLVMNEIVDESLSTIQVLRHKAYTERFGRPLSEMTMAMAAGTAAQGSSSSSKGQDHLLFHNLLAQQEPPHTTVGNSSSNDNHNNGTTATPLKARGRGRKIAESFEAERKNGSQESIQTHPRNHHHPHNHNHNNQKTPLGGLPSNRSVAAAATPKTTILSQAALEDFEVGLSKLIATHCPTRLWIRRRHLSKRHRSKAKQQRLEACVDPEVLLLDANTDYQPGEDYFGTKPPQQQQQHPSPCPEAQPNTNNPSLPNPYKSTHIYAVRYSETGGTENAPGSWSLSLASDADGGPTRTESLPPLEPDPFSVATATPAILHGGATLGKEEGASAGSIFGPANMALPPKRDVVGWTTVSEEHDIYVVDLGLTPALCNALVTTTEQACKGRYAAYTYAKQTLGCREYPHLALAALGPVHSMVGAILEKFGGQGPKDGTTVSRQTAVPNVSPAEKAAVAKGSEPTITHQDDGGATGTPPPSPPAARQAKPSVVLQLDDREPHIVKYDVTKKERQKLDMHTDKSEWTFLIALSDGCGSDYEGGGTYFECLDATVHIQKGHALVFPGRLRHKGQAIHRGLRFLLVGFLVDKGEAAAATAVPATVVAADARSAVAQNSSEIGTAADTGATTPRTDATLSCGGTPGSKDENGIEVVLPPLARRVTAA